MNDFLEISADLTQGGSSDRSSVAVPADLRPWVSRIAIGAIASRQGVLTRLPDTATRLVLRTTPTDDSAELFVVGPQTKATYHPAAKDVPLIIELRLQPGCAAAVLGTGANEVRNRIVPLQDVWGPQARDFVPSLRAEEGDVGRLLASIRAALAARLSCLSTRGQTRARLALAAAATLADRRPALRIGEVAAQLHLSERQLRTTFSDAIGLSPKQYARIERVRAVVGGLERAELARLAADLGYYDQSHLTGEFSSIMGIAPRAFLNGSRPPPAQC